MKEKIIKFAPILIFIVLLAGTFFAWKVTSDVVLQESKNIFYQDSLKIKNLFQIKLNLYILVSEGLSGLVEVNSNINRDEWLTYIKKAKLLENNPGISSLNYVERVTNKNKKAFVENIRKDTSINPTDYPNFNIFPDGERDEYYVIKYIAPFKGRESALGFDLGSENKRLQIIKKMLNSGETLSTGKIILVTTQKPGFGFLVPINEKGTDLDNFEERKTNVKGFIYMVFRSEDLFKLIYGTTNPFPDIDFEIYESENLSVENLLHDQYPNYIISESTARPGLFVKDTLTVDKHNWVILISATDKFGLTASQKALPIIALGSGLIASFTFLGVYLYMKKQNRTISQSLKL